MVSSNRNMLAESNCPMIDLIHLEESPSVSGYTGTRRPVWIKFSPVPAGLFSSSPPNFSYDGLEKYIPFLPAATFPARAIWSFGRRIFVKYGLLNHTALIVPVASFINASVINSFFLHVLVVSMAIISPCTQESWLILTFAIESKREKSS